MNECASCFSVTPRLHYRLEKLAALFGCCFRAPPSRCFGRCSGPARAVFCGAGVIGLSGFGNPSGFLARGMSAGACRQGGGRVSARIPVLLRADVGLQEVTRRGFEVAALQRVCPFCLRQVRGRVSTCACACGGGAAAVQAGAGGQGIGGSGERARGVSVGGVSHKRARP